LGLEVDFSSVARAMDPRRAFGGKEWQIAAGGGAATGCAVGPCGERRSGIGSHPTEPHARAAGGDPGDDRSFMLAA
jgi:hypothetical protein